MGIKENETAKNVIYFGCGGLFGGLLGLYFVIRFLGIITLIPVLLVFSASVFFFGFLSAKYGDHFWDSENIRSWLRWL